MIERRWAAPAVLGLALVLVVAIVRHRQDNAMNDIATPGHPLPSPSGHYRVLVVDTQDEGGLPAQTFVIQNDHGDPVFGPDEQWATRHRLVFVWGAGDRLWVYSGDVGTDIWENVDGTWTKRPYVRDGDLTAPEALKRLAPAIFR